MRDVAGIVGSIGGFACGLASLVSFSMAMVRSGEIVWLLVGWFAAPITAVVWPAFAGVDWLVAFYVGLVVSVALVAVAEHGSDSADQQHLIGHLAYHRVLGSPGLASESSSGVLIQSDPLPPQAIDEEVLAQGLGQLFGLLLSDPNSPVVLVRATNSALWALNLLDDSLFERLPWGTVRDASKRQDGRWSVSIASETGDWHTMVLDPGDDAAGWDQLLEPFVRQITL